MNDGLLRKVKSKKRRTFYINKSVKMLNDLIGNQLPTDEVYKLISFSGGFASISFIRAVAEKEIIEELYASTLRIGEKQFKYLAQLREQGRLINSTFFIGSMMKNVDSKSKYDYFTRFNSYCDENGWDRFTINNHSKIILMRTMDNCYVLETSSNLNENPSIEQYSFENSKELFEFYQQFFDRLKQLV